MIPKLLFKAGKTIIKKGKKKLKKIKAKPTYAKIKASEGKVRTAMGMKGKGKTNVMRRKIKGPVGYTALGASLFMGDDD